MALSGGTCIEEFKFEHVCIMHAAATGYDQVDVLSPDTGFTMSIKIAFIIMLHPSSTETSDDHHAVLSILLLFYLLTMMKIDVEFC